MTTPNSSLAPPPGAGDPRLPSASPTLTTVEWLAALESSFALDESGEAARAASALFSEDCFWRDLLSFTWNIVTLEGRSAIESMLTARISETCPRNFKIEGAEVNEGDGIIRSKFSFETVASTGHGHLRLNQDGRCWTLLTAMDELVDHRERTGHARALGVDHSFGLKGRQSWLEQREEEKASLGKTHNPFCVIIGGGQAGIVLGARLRLLGVPSIILESNEKAGDSWRKRYKSLVLHDPVWYDHLPFLPFPSSWPVFTPKDKMGDFLEAYTNIMELNYWTNSKCLGACYDEKSALWEILVRGSNGEEVAINANHLVLATGMSGEWRLESMA